MLQQYWDASAICRRIFFFSTILWACNSNVVAEEPIDINRVLLATERLSLSQHPTWLRLLHFEIGSEKSSILTDSFFINPDGSTQPQKELSDFIRAIFSGDALSDDHPVCRFPSRYFWLSQHVSIPSYQLTEECPKLKKWGHVQKTKSASLLMVSGYFGNPASTFGHSLLKFNQYEDPNAPTFQDLSINYGVSVPENENSLRYVILGLTGGYEGKFSDQPFYNQDLIYSRRESRDIWEYRLSLSQDQLTLLILHLFEIIDREYKYLFLDKNCGFRIAELIDLVVEENLLDEVGLYYAPVALFHRLHDIDRKRLLDGKPPIISSVTFIPSASRKLSHELSGLNRKQLSLLNQVIKSGISTVDSVIKNEDPGEQVRILNSLLAYHHFLDMSEVPNLSPQRQTDRNLLLLSRLKRPADLFSAMDIPEVQPPTSGFAPTAASLGLGINSKNALSFILSFSPYRQQAIGYNSLEGGELVVADVEIGIDRRLRSPILRRLELIRALSINVIPVRIRGMSNKSWRFRFGIDGHTHTIKEYDGVASGGLGMARKFGRNFIGFTFIDLELHTLSPMARIRLDSGLALSGERLKLNANGGIFSRGFAKRWKVDYSISALYRLSEKKSMEVVYRGDSAMTSITLSSYF